MTGLAGELFVAAELLRRGLQTSVTFGNAKAIDLFAHNPRTGRNFAIQVKALRKPNFFLLSHASVRQDQVYVFVLLGEPGERVKYYIVPGQTLHEQPERFSRFFIAEKMPGIHARFLDAMPEYVEAWQVFEEVPSASGKSKNSRLGLRGSTD